MPAASDAGEIVGSDPQDGGSVVDTLVDLEPSDDAGAETAARYEWQAAVAAADALSMLAEHMRRDSENPPSDEVFVICELHEDWINCADGSAELVSAKHREATHATVSTLPALIDDLGIGHLFTRWLRADREPSTRLVTTAALTGVCGDVAALCTALAAGEQCTDAQELLVDRLGREVMFRGAGLPEQWRPDPAVRRADDCTVGEDHRTDVRAFCARLKVDEALPRRQFIGAAAANMYAAPVVALAGGDAGCCEAVWQAVLMVVRRAMQAAGNAPLGALPEALGGVRRTRFTELEPRVVRLRAVAIAVQQAIANPAAFTPLRPPTARRSRLQIKMRRGGCTGTSIKRAESLRADYMAYVEAKRIGVPLVDARSRLLARNLHRIADETVQDLSDESAVWGRTFWRELPARLAAWNDEERPADLTPDIALGGVSDLIEHCMVWLSEDESDVNPELQASRTGDTP